MQFRKTFVFVFIIILSLFEKYQKILGDKTFLFSETTRLSVLFFEIRLYCVAIKVFIRNNKNINCDIILELEENSEMYIVC